MVVVVGTATGTTSWSVGGITLQSGVNVITVTARDAANNTGTDTLTVTYSESTFVIQPGPEGTDTCYGTVYVTNGAPDAASLYIGGWAIFTMTSFGLTLPALRLQQRQYRQNSIFMATPQMTLYLG